MDSALDCTIANDIQLISFDTMSAPETYSLFALQETHHVNTGSSKIMSVTQTQRWQSRMRQAS